MYKPKEAFSMWHVSKDGHVVTRYKPSPWRCEIEELCDELNKPLKTILTDTSNLEIEK